MYWCFFWFNGYEVTTGDTGLLDHLLKHLADKCVTTAGDKLRRRHNTEGHMEYWLQSPASAQTGAVLTSATTDVSVKKARLAYPSLKPSRDALDLFRDFHDRCANLRCKTCVHSGPNSRAIKMLEGRL